jgi:DNA-binding response OmpR family regulator
VTTSVLVVEDDSSLQRTIRQTLEGEGYVVRLASSAEDALLELRKAVPDLAVLDVRLPGMNGFDLCRKIRATPEWKALPVIFLTSKGEESSRILGLELGGDDYIVKPFSLMELAARVKAVLRRGRGDEKEEVLQEGSLTLNAGERTVTVDGKTVRLRAKEFNLLRALVQRKGRFLSRSVLMDVVWGQDYSATTRTVDSHVYRLRKHLGSLGGCIQSVEKLGYKWEEE